MRGPFLPTAGTVTIANGGTVSAALDLQSATLLGLQTPATLTGTALSFQVSADGSTYTVLNDPTTNTAISYSVTTSTGYAFDPVVFLGWRYVKVVSNAAEGGARSITLVSRIVE